MTCHFPTHDKNHILDLVITSSDTSLAPAVSCTHRSPSDHLPVFTRFSINPAPLPPPTLHSFRQLHSIDVGSFLTDLESSQLILDPPKSLRPLLSAYNTTPSSHSAADWSSFKSLRNQQAHPVFHKRVLLQPRIFSHRQPQTSLANSQQTPTPQILLTTTHHFSWHFTCRQLCFFFTGKISKLPLYLTSKPSTSSSHSPSPPATPPNFSVFTPAPESEVHKILSN